MSTLALSSGCVQVPQNDVKLYTHSSAALIEQVDKLIAEYHLATFERKLTMLSVEVGSKGEGLLSSSKLASIETTSAPQNLPIVQASQALKAYSEALMTLMQAEHSTETELASVDLYRSISQVNTSAAELNAIDAPLNEDNLRLFSSLVAQLGNAYSEKEKQQAIKRIVLEADPVVSLLCEGMLETLEQSNIAVALSTSRSYVLAEEIRDFNNRVQIRTMALNKSRKEVEYLYRRWQEVATTQMAVDQSISAIKAVQKSHHVLADELTRDVFASAAIKQAIAEMQELKQGFDSVDELLATCDGTVEKKNNQLICNS
ncbi:hypothetical protein QWZ04_12015 [Vibrio tapetis subsp. quintayensis]|uniref:hypothetical protein n=1 Tax=Vibrio tapetis TaxID=52443 RepID=UPI0025B30918|nr:hypothetical protein [Vibrio tapetis]MDN3681049.1 hypothetical protein [Vibrio tapetis subsp. quintayensis]